MIQKTHSREDQLILKLELSDQLIGKKKRRKQEEVRRNNYQQQIKASNTVDITYTENISRYYK